MQGVGGPRDLGELQLRVKFESIREVRVPSQPQDTQTQLRLLLSWTRRTGSCRGTSDTRPRNVSD